MSPSKMERFTARARLVLKLAEQSAENLDHNSIGTEHLLLAFLHEGGGVANRVLRDLGLEENRVSELVKDLSRARPHVQGESLDLSPGTKRVLELSVDEARRMGHHYIGTEHLLLGMVRQTDGTAIDILNQLGINQEQVRRQTRRVLQEAPAQSQPRITDPSMTPVSLPAVPMPTQMDATQRSRILQMLENGKITAAEATGLLRALQPQTEAFANPAAPHTFARPISLNQRMHLVVTEKASGTVTLDITFTLDASSLLNVLVNSQPGTYLAEDDTHKITMDILKDDEDKP